MHAGFVRHLDHYSKLCGSNTYMTSDPSLQCISQVMAQECTPFDETFDQYYKYGGERYLKCNMYNAAGFKKLKEFIMAQMYVFTT